MKANRMVKAIMMIMCLSSCLSARADGGKGEWESGRLFDRLRLQAVTEPQEALRRIDSLEMYSSSLPPVDLELLRAYVYRGWHTRSRALLHAAHTLELARMGNDIGAQSRAYMLLAESTALLNRLNDCMEYVRDGFRHAYLHGDTLLRASMIQAHSAVQRKMGQTGRSYEIMKRAVELLDGSESLEQLYLLAHIYGYLATFSIEDGYFDRAHAWCGKRAGVMERMEEHGATRVMLDIQRGYHYSKMAFLYRREGRVEEASRYLALFRGTAFAYSAMGRAEINDFLLADGQYEQVLRNNRERMGLLADADTLGTEYVKLLAQNSRAYSGIGDYREACRLERKIDGIQHTLRVGEYRRHVERIDGDITHEVEMERAEARVTDRNRLIVMMAVCMAVLLAMLGLLWRRNRTIHRYEQRMSGYITELADLKKEMEGLVGVHRVPQPGSVSPEVELPDGGKPQAGQDAPAVEAEPVAEAVSKDRELFEAFHAQVVERGLFLDYQYGRDQYMALMGVDRNRFARIMKEQGGGNLAHYLNGLRMDYSVELIREHPELSNQEIADRSALPNLSTFYRLFKEYFGMSPTQFRRSVGGNGGSTGG